MQMMEYETVRNMVFEYVSSLETELSEGSCICSWIMVDTNYGKRKVKAEVSLECPVHTREGLILHFLLNKLPDGVRIVGKPKVREIVTLQVKELKPDAPIEDGY